MSFRSRSLRLPARLSPSTGTGSCGPGCVSSASSCRTPVISAWAPKATYPGNVCLRSTKQAFNLPRFAAEWSLGGPAISLHGQIELFPRFPLRRAFRAIFYRFARVYLRWRKGIPRFLWRKHPIAMHPAEAGGRFFGLYGWVWPCSCVPVLRVQRGV